MGDGLSFFLELNAKFDSMFGMNKALKQTDDMLKKVDGGLKAVEGNTGRARDANGRFLAGLKKTEQAIGAGTRALGNHGAEGRKLGGVFDGLMGKAGALGSSLKGVGVGIGVMGAAAAGAMLGRAAGGAIHFGVEMVKAAAEAEQFDKSMELLLGKRGAQDELDQIDRIFKFTPHAPDEIKGLTHGLLKDGFRGDALTRARAASLDLGALSGEGFAGTQAAAGALSMMQRTGRISDRILKPLGVGEKDFMKELSDRTGLGIATLNDKINKGTFDTSLALETFYGMVVKKTKRDLGGAGVEMSKTLGARLTRLGSVPGEIMEKFKDTPAFSVLSDQIDRIFTTLDPNGPNGQKLVGMLERISGGLGKGLATFDVSKALDKFINGVEQAIGVVRVLGNAFSFVVDVLKHIPILSPLMQLAIKTAEAGVAKDRLDHDLSKVTEKWGTKESDVPDWLTKSDKIGRGIGDGLGNGMRKATAGVDAVSRSMAGTAIEATRDKLENHSPSKVFERIGLSVGQGFDVGIRKSTAATDDIIRGAFAIPTPGGAGTGLGGPIQVSVSVGDINVNAPAADGRQIAEEISVQLTKITPSMLKSAFEQIAIMSGG